MGSYASDKVIRVFPTLQFLYSHHIEAEYITDDVKAHIKESAGRAEGYQRFVQTVLLRGHGAENKRDDDDDDDVAMSNVVADDDDDRADALQRLGVRVERC